MCPRIHLCSRIFYSFVAPSTVGRSGVWLLVSWWFLHLQISLRVKEYENMEVLCKASPWKSYPGLQYYFRRPCNSNCHANENFSFCVTKLRLVTKWESWDFTDLSGHATTHKQEHRFMYVRERRLIKSMAACDTLVMTFHTSDYENLKPWKNVSIWWSRVHVSIQTHSDWVEIPLRRRK